MSWAGIASNQCVSFTNLKDAVNTGVFTQKTTIPTSDEQITKDDANTYVNINTSYAPYAAKASNQLVVKSDLQAAVVSYGWMFNGGGAGFSTSAAALATFTGGPYRYSNINGMVSNVTIFYADSALIYPFNGGNLWYCCQLNGTGTRYAAYINGSGVVTTYTT